MKLSKREKILLAFSGAIIILFMIYNFVLSPQLAKLDELKSKAEDLEQDVRDSNSSIDSIEMLNEEINKKSEEIETVTGNLFPSLEQDKIIVLLDELIEKSNLYAEVISFTEITSSVVDIREVDETNEENENKFNELVNEYQDLNNEDQENNIENHKVNHREGEEIPIENISSTISYSGSYKELIDFVNHVEDYERDIVINEITISGNGDDVSGSLQLIFYGIPQISQLEEITSDLPLGNVKGKSNPFK